MALCCPHAVLYRVCPTPCPSGIRVGLITPGSIADAAWNSGAYAGLQRIHDSLGLAMSHVEAQTPAEQDEALRTYAAQGYDLVFAHGFEFQGPAERVSAEYPKTVFIVTSGARARGNVAPLIFKLEEASYLAGMVAGGLTQSNILGFVGGIELPPIKAAYEGWVNGAKAVNPKVRSREIYLNSFDDAAAGREAALALVRVGADMFHHNADAAALGLFQAVRNRPGSTCSAPTPTRRRWPRTGWWEARSSIFPGPSSWWPGGEGGDLQASAWKLRARQRGRCATSPTRRSIPRARRAQGPGQGGGRLDRRRHPAPGGPSRFHESAVPAVNRSAETDRRGAARRHRPVPGRVSPRPRRARRAECGQRAPGRESAGCAAASSPRSTRLKRPSTG